VLKLELQIYPDSSDAYESLGEAYQKSGEKQLAVESYKKALEKTRRTLVPSRSWRRWTRCRRRSEEGNFAEDVAQFYGQSEAVGPGNYVAGGLGAGDELAMSHNTNNQNHKFGWLQGLRK